MNKYNFWGLVAGIATFITSFGYWAKITHQAFADIILAIGLWTLGVSAAVYVYFMFSRLNEKK